MSVKTFYNLCRLGVRQVARSSSSRAVTNKLTFLRSLQISSSASSYIHPKPAAEGCSIVKTFPTSHQSLSIGFQDHLESDFQYIWLRDNCHCPKCIHPENRQKVIDTVNLDIHIKPKSYRLTENGQLMIVWPDKDGQEHVSTYDPNWLHKYGKGFELEKSIHNELPPMVTWNREKIENIKPEISYDEVMNTDKGVRDWLEMLYKYGVAVMRDVPCRRDEVVNVVERFAYIKKTKWGTSFDVLCEPVQTDTKHLAFTGVYLEHHTDMNYLEKSPGLQALHCLKADALSEGEEVGGQSFFVDGFYIAKWLRKHHPASFHALTSTIVNFKIYSHRMEYSNHQNVICANRNGDIQEVHYNTRTMAPLEGPPEAVQPFYEAYKLFGQKMREPESEFKFNLKPGDLVAFNNRRILHGRTQFNPAKVYRHLQGCYGDIDEVITRYKASIKESMLRNR